MNLKKHKSSGPKTLAELRVLVEQEGQLENMKRQAADNPVCQALSGKEGELCGKAMVLFLSHTTADSLPSSFLHPLV
jgi:hypothetical protein